MRSQSEAAISRLESKIGALETALTAFDAFIDDETNEGLAFSNVRLKMQDFRLATTGLINAARADIADHRTLINAVGDEYLNGAIILDAIDSNTRSKETARVWRDHFSGIMRDIPWILSNFLNPTWRNARNSRDRWQGIFDYHYDRIRDYEQKMRDFHNINVSIMFLFTNGNSLRSVAKRGLEYIQEAAEGLPDSYDSVALGGWREEMRVTLVTALRGLSPDFADKSDEELLAYMRELELAGESIFCRYGGDPINMSTGNFIYTKEDISVPGRYPLEFKRFYNSVGGTNGTVGIGWTHNYNIRMYTNEESMIVTFADGHIEMYKVTDDGGYIGPPESDNELVKIDEGWELSTKNNETYHFDKEGLLQRIEDLNGNATEFEYKDEQLLKVSTLSGSLTFDYAYDSNHLMRVSDHTGRVVRFKYNDDRLVRVRHPNRAEYKYEYDENGKLCNMWNPLGIEAIKNEYDSEGRMIRQSFADGGEYLLSYDGNTTISIEQNDNVIKYERDERHRTVATIYSDSEERFEFNDQNRRTKHIDRNGNTTSFEYDKMGDLCAITNALGVETEFKYDYNNKLYKILVDGRIKVRNTYDEGGNLKTIEDALKNKTTLTYSENGIPEIITQPDGSQIHLTYDERRNISKMVDASGIETQYKYDNLNRVISTIDGNGHETNYQYDVAGNIIEVKNAAGNTRNYVYNKSNKVTEVTDFDGSRLSCEYNELYKPSKFTDQLGRETLLDYDIMWNVSQVTTPNGSVTKYIYNQANRLETVIKPDLNTVSFEYDFNGNRTLVRDEEGKETHLCYDALGQLIEISGEEGLKYSYTYNAEGQIVSVIDCMGNAVTHEYNELGQLTRETNALGYSREYTYTSLGDISTEKDEVGRLTRHEYAPGGRLVATYYWDDTTEIFEYDNVGNIKVYKNEEEVVQRFEYDLFGRVTQISVDGGGVKKCSYDAVGNVISVTDERKSETKYEYTLTGQLSKAIDMLGNETHYLYNELDQLIEVKQLGSELLAMDADVEAVVARNIENQSIRITKYNRNIMGQIQSVEDALGNIEKYCYSPTGKLAEKIDKDGFLTKYRYSARGDITNVQYADGREVAMSYNPLRQLTEITDWLGTTQIEVDALGRTTRVCDHNDNIIEYTWGKLGECRGITYPDGRKVSYDYDEHLLLTKVHDGNHAVNYIYDDDFALMEKQFSGGARTRYEYNDLGQISELSHFGLTGLLDKYIYSYDLAGNKSSVFKQRSELESENGLFEYSYDPLSRLSEVAKDGNILRSYVYDDYGNRASIIEGGTKIEYTYNALNQLISSTDGTQYKYDKRGNMIESRRNGVLTRQHYYGALNRVEKTFNHELNIGGVYAYNGLNRRVGHIEGTGVAPILPNIENMVVSPMKRVEDVIDLARPFNNLLARSENGNTQSFTWDIDLLYSSGLDGSYNYLQDDLYSPMRLIDSVGEQRDVLVFDEFGNSSNTHKSKVINPFGFTGYRTDDILHTGTYHAQSREYRPEIGRFVSQDAHWHMGNMIFGDMEKYASYEIHNGAPDPFAIRQSSNLYEYTLNNPINYLDPSGNCIWLIPPIRTFITTTAAPAVKNAAPQVWNVVRPYVIGGLVDAGMQVIFPEDRDANLRERFEQIDWGRVAISAGTMGTAGLASSLLSSVRWLSPVAYGLAGFTRDASLQGRDGGFANINWLQAGLSGVLTAGFTWLGGWLGGRDGASGPIANRINQWLGPTGYELGGRSSKYIINYTPVIFRALGGRLRNFITDLLWPDSYEKSLYEKSLEEKNI